jgi:hypothetical protein
MGVVIAHCSATPALLAFLAELIGQTPDCPETRQAAMLGMIARIVQTVPGEVADREDEILELLFALLQNRSPALYNEAFVIFSAIIQARPDRCESFAGPFLEVVHAAFESGLPGVVGIAALAFGDFCRGLGRSALEAVFAEIEFLVGLLDPRAGERDAVPNVLQALGLVIDAVGLEMGIVKVKELWEIVVWWGNGELDMRQKEDRAFAPALFDGVAQALTSLVRAVNCIESGDTGFVRAVKTRLFPIIHRIWVLNAYSVETLFSVCPLIETLMEVMGKAVNVQLSSKAVGGLIHAAILTVIDG